MRFPIGGWSQEEPKREGGPATMAKDRIALLEVFPRVVTQMLMEHEVKQAVGAGPYERAAGRQTYRNGYRSRDWDMWLGTLELQIPRLRRASWWFSAKAQRARVSRSVRRASGPFPSCARANNRERRHSGPGLWCASFCRLLSQHDEFAVQAVAEKIESG